MTTIATIGRPVADGWQFSVGSGWIVVMLIGMAVCFVAMFASRWLATDGRGWSMCGLRGPQETPRGNTRTDTPGPSPEPAVGSPEREVRR